MYKCSLNELTYGASEPYNNHGHFVGHSHKCDRCGFKILLELQYPREESVEK